MRISWTAGVVSLALAALAGPGVAALNAGDAGAATTGDPGSGGQDRPVAGYEVVALRAVTAGNNEPRTATCPPGKKVLGGGGHAEDVTAVLTASSPAAGGTGWTARGAGGDGDVTLSVWAVCAKVG